MSDTVTVLTSLSHALTKKIVKTEVGLATRTSQNVLYYRGEEIEVSDIRSLAALLEAVSTDPQKCVVRGAIAAGTNRARMLRRKFPKPEVDEAATLLEQPRSWLLCDFDGVELPSGFDPFADPVETARLVAAKLPGCFHGASLWYQFTASAGIKPGLHIRLGYWLDRALGESELKLWLGQKIAEPGRSRKDWFKEFPVDTSFFGTVQPNYIAAPIIGRGAHDPLAGSCARSGFITGAFDVVTAPLIEARPVQLSAMRERVGAALGSTFAECLGAIGDHDGGNGCHNALRHAVAVYYRRNGADASPEKLKDLLRARVDAAEWDRAVHSVEYVQKDFERIDTLIDVVRGQQRASERQAEEERTRAICPWPDAGLTLAEAEPVLQEKVEQFFDQSVSNGIEQRAGYEAALEAFKTDGDARHAAAAEAEFGVGDADDIFSEPDPEAPEPPRYAQHGIKITAGAGKTHATIAKMVTDVRVHRRTFVYSVPTHAKAEEVALQINSMAGEPIAAVWRGIDRDDPDAPGFKMCRRSETVKEVVKSLGSIAHVCGSAQRGYCPYHPAVGGTCGYRPQVDQKPKIWVVTHATLTTPPQACMENADALIIDEALGIGNYREDDLAISDFLAARKRPSRLDAILERAKRALGQIAPGSYISRAPFEDEGFTSETCKVALTCEAYGFERVAKTFEPGNDDAAIIIKVEAAGAANRVVLTRQAFWRILGKLLEGTAVSSARLKLLPGDGDAVRVASPWRPHTKWLDRPVLHIDATLDPTIVAAWLPRFELLADIRVERGEGVTVHQVIEPVSYGRIIPGAGTDKSSEKRTSQQNNLQKIMRRIEVSAAEDRRSGGTAGCVAPKDLEAMMEEIWKSWGTRPANLLTGHFGDLRGRNNLETCRRLIVMSRPEPNASEIERLAGIEFGHHPASELGTGYYPTRAVALRTGGNSRAVVQEPYHPDAHSMALLRQVRDAEITQAAHRARAVRRGKDRPLVIEIVSSVPVDVVVDQTGTFDDWLETSPAHLLLARGMWPDDWADKQAVLRDLYPTKQAIRRGFQENPTAAELRRGVELAMSGKDAQTPYIDTLIRGLGSFQDAVGWPCFRYRVAGARRSHLIAVDPVLHPDARSAWTSRLGKPLDLFEPVERPNMPGRSGLVASEDRLGGPPVVRPPAAPSVASDVFGTDRRVAGAPPLPAAPLHVLTHAGHVRFWADGGEGQPILMRSVSKPAQIDPPRTAPVAEPLLTVDDLRAHVGVSAFALKNAMGRSKYRKLQGEERERAAIRWLTVKVGREQFIAAVRDLAETTKRGGAQQ